ncbi:MAG: hypothetical protein PHQ65_00855 [Bacteroidales bacterium]|nr:hypothetical protein [Bacteroidales bacterium]
MEFQSFRCFHPVVLVSFCCCFQFNKRRFSASFRMISVEDEPLTILFGRAKHGSSNPVDRSVGVLNFQLHSTTNMHAKTFLRQTVVFVPPWPLVVSKKDVLSWLPDV